MLRVRYRWIAVHNSSPFSKSQSESGIPMPHMIYDDNDILEIAMSELLTILSDYGVGD